jgi:glyoxylate reductase
LPNNRSMLPNVFITQAIPSKPLARLSKFAEIVISPQDGPVSREALEKGVAEARGLVSMLTDRIDAALLDKAPQLKIVANYAVGTNNIDLAACRARGIAVTNTPDVLTEATADLAMGLILDVARGITSGDKAMRRGEFKAWGPLYRLGTEVSGKTLGLVGFGRIGQALATRARAFRMRVLYTQRRVLEGHPEASYLGLEELLRLSNFVSLHCPLTEATRHLIGARELGWFKPGAILINTARGPVVDEAALVQALREGKLAGAGLDVFEREPDFEPELATMDQVVMPPHLGSATRETRDAMAELVVDNLIAVFKGENPSQQVL